MEFILMEATNPNNTVYKRRYKCPYCDTRLERNKLITHIERKHEDLIPKDYTATRVVFNLINKKEHGTCTICGKESPWNEDKARYDRICTNPKCKKEYEDLVARRIMKVHGKTKEDMLHDPEFQSKMLAGRSISGTYKFSDGSKKTYTGSYEKNFVEFMDAYFHVKSEDLEMPGPVIEYEYAGKKHMWITDAYYAPYNLVFDIKDGGDNPNNREMKSYREKQEAKEKAIAKLGTYNYIRLTNNNFEQLILLMLELKDLLIDNIGKDKDIKPIIRINESTDISYDSRDVAKRMYSSGDIVKKENDHKETYKFIFSSNDYQKKEPQYLLYYPDIKVTDKEDIEYNSKYDMIYRIGGEHARKLEEFKAKYKEESSNPNSNKRIIRIDKDIFSQLENNGIITEETLSGKYNAFHLEKDYKDPKNCCWDEELYYKTMNDMIKAEAGLKTLDNGKHHVYTCDKELKVIYLGQILIKKDNDNFSYKWIKVNESAILENNINTDLVKKQYNPNNDQKSHLNYLKKKQRDNKTNSATKQSETPTPSKLNEEAIYNNKDKYPVFITLMHSGTYLSNIIKKVTKDEFSHACISFNSKLDPMYSFGSKKLEGFDLGLVRHNSNADFYKRYKAHYRVYVMFVDSESYTKIMKRLKWFENNSEKLKYDLFGLIKIFFNHDTEKNKYKYFCSRFVAELIGNAKPLDKLPSLYKPEEFKDLYYVSLVNGGEDFSKYNYKNTERNLEQIKKGIYDDIMFSEDCSTTMGTMVGPKSNSDSVYIINYLKKNSFSGEDNGDKEYALTTGKDMTDIFYYDKDKKSFNRISFEEFRSIAECVELYRFDGYARILDLLENCESDIDIYTSLSNMKFNNHDQIRYDHMFIREESLYDEINIIKESLESSIYKMDKMRIPNIGMIAECALYTEDCPIMYYNDIDGVFVMNESTHMRSKSYKDIKSIPSSVIRYITTGKI